MPLGAGFHGDAGSLKNMIDGYRDLLLDPPDSFPTTGFGSNTARFRDAWQLAKNEELSELPSDINTINAGINLTEKEGELANIKYTARHHYAELVILAKYGGNLLLTRDDLDNTAISKKIDQIYGDAALTQSDTEIVANNGITSSQRFGILIEDQPNITGLAFEKLGKLFGVTDNGFGASHSMILVIDSLSVTSLMQKIDHSVSRALAETIMISASAAKANSELGDVGNDSYFFNFGDEFITRLAA